MIKATELRIGNTIQYHLIDNIGPVEEHVDEWVETNIDWEDLQQVSENEEGFNEWHRPIPLSEEVLMRLGFECSYKSNMHSVYSLGDGKISYYFWYGTGNSYLSIVGTKFICNTVHHLQNIVHDLLGHELELKK
jgi:hypothetical protein